MRYRSTLFSSKFLGGLKVSFCQVIYPRELPDLDSISKNLKAIKMDREFSEYLILVSEKLFAAEIKDRFKQDLADGHLKIALYSKIPESRLLNLASSIASGAVIMTLGASDYLAPRMATFIYNELLLEKEKALVFEKKGKLPKRIAMFRNTFYEIGGFDEMKVPNLQVKNMSNRLEQMGVSVEQRPHDHLTRSSDKRKRLFSFRKPKSPIKLELNQPVQGEYKWLE